MRVAKGGGDTGYGSGVEENGPDVAVASEQSVAGGQVVVGDIGSRSLENFDTNRSVLEINERVRDGQVDQRVEFGGQVDQRVELVMEEINPHSARKFSVNRQASQMDDGVARVGRGGLVVLESLYGDSLKKFSMNR